ncbi:MAG TPA: type II toxin-antitoxin system Phd/YefM family antitoxin [Blastocatellia bacterium]|nr:type II toxin-antitoxin system Phd/YefM family antitoxin [Blastocatellia bacterium]
MKIAPVADVKARFSSYLEQSEEGPVIITKNGRPVAALISVPDEEELERLVLAHTPKFRSLLDAAEKRIQRGGGLKHGEFWTTVRAKARP